MVLAVFVAMNRDEEFEYLRNGVDRMRCLTKKAEELLCEILNHRLENGKCDVSYWKDTFEVLSASEGMILRSLFKELIEADMISVGWGDNYPYILMLLGKGISYFDEIKREEENRNMNSYVNNFYGNENNVQLQQGGVNSTQIISNDGFEYEQVKEIIEIIRKYDAVLDTEFGESADDLRESCNTLDKAIKENRGKEVIKGIVKYIRDLSVNAAGGIIAARVIEIISKMTG